MKREQIDDPRGFAAVARHVGVKEADLDFMVVASEREATAAAVLTRSRFCGAPVSIARGSVADGRLRAITAVAGNANVATGAQGERDAQEIVELVASELSIDPSLVLPAATGVIGRPLPMQEIRDGAGGIGGHLGGGQMAAAAKAIMTTDSHVKVASVSLGDVTLTGMAKGAGMMAPDMATLLSFFFTDAEIPQSELDRVLRQAVGRTYNRLSVDTDTSTSDTVAVMANGLAGPVDLDEFGNALEEMALVFTREIARDGEGATKLLTVTVSRASDEEQAERVAKTIVNSPLVKTAAFGGDPNWGRVAMAMGKCFEVPIVPEQVQIAFGGTVVYDRGKIADESQLEELEGYLTGEEVQIDVVLGLGAAEASVYGCDLSYDYVRLNGEYTS